MAKYQHAYIIPDGAQIKGGVLYDRWGNFSYFADTAALVDKTQTATDVATPVTGFEREKFMRSNGKVQVSATTRYYTTGLRQQKGAIPGVPITLKSGVEKRAFMYDGNLSGLVIWLKDNALVDIDMFGPRGTPYDPIPAFGPGPG